MGWGYTNGEGRRIAGADKVRKSDDERIQERQEEWEGGWGFTVV